VFGQGYTYRNTGRPQTRVQTPRLAAGLLTAIAAIHLITAPDNFNDALYKGVLFLAAAGGALVAAGGLWRGARWGWILGAAVAGSTLVGYFISRTVGLPALPVDPDWLEPLGAVSVVAEALFLAQAVRALRPVRGEPPAVPAP